MVRTYLSKPWFRNVLRYVFVIVLIASIYHLVRDILQTIDMDSSFTDVLHRQHLWCGAYCDYVTYPFDIMGIALSVYALRTGHYKIPAALLTAAGIVTVIFNSLP